MNLHELGIKIALIVFLLVGFCSYVVPTWAATGGSYVLPPQEVVGQIRVVDRPGCRLVMEEQNLEFFATDPRQLNGLAEARKFGSGFTSRTVNN